MGRHKKTLTFKLSESCKKFNFLKVEKNILYCSICSDVVNFRENRITSCINDHINSKTHKSIMCKTKLQPSILSAISTSKTKIDKQSEFFFDLTKVFSQSAIPLRKIDRPEWQEFLKKYTEFSVPDSSTLRKNYVEKVYNKCVQEIQEFIKDSDIYLIVDEATDICGRAILNILVGALNGKPQKPKLLSSNVLEKTNNFTVSQCFQNSLLLLWNGEIKYEKVYLVVTDAASYMTLSFKNLKNLFPNMHHITCVIHALHRVSEKIRENFSELNNFVSLMKKILLKSKERKIVYKNITNLPFPPSTIITRWGTFIKASLFYSENFSIIEKFINEIKTDSTAVKMVKEGVKKDALKSELLEIKKFDLLPSSMTKLESEKLSITEQLNILNELKKTLPDFAIQKLNLCLDKNPDLEKFTDISNNYDFLQKTLYAPLNSSSVERSFSIMNYLLTNRRQNMSEINLEKYLVICCNSEH